MIRVTAYYRWKDGASFDHDYYRKEHMRIARDLLSPHGLLRLESDRFLVSTPPAGGAIVAATNAYFPSIEVAQKALAVSGPALLADVANYTNIKPDMQFSIITSHA
jgi:uncharacterized protein (TIGR02118 family)